MEMVIKCPACSMDLTVEDTAAGSQIKCPTCNTLLVVPAVSQQATEESAVQSKTSSLSGASDEQLAKKLAEACLLYTSPSPRDGLLSRMPSSA